MPDLTAKPIYVVHILSRVAFCFIVLGLTLAGYTWVLLSLAAVSAKVCWVVDIYTRGRRVGASQCIFGRVWSSPPFLHG